MFQKAKAVCLQGIPNIYNRNVVYAAELTQENGVEYTMLLTASDRYKLYVNGKFVADGPARAAKGTFRVDRLDLTKVLRHGKNRLAVWVSESGVRCFAHCKNEGFLIAEVLADGRPQIWTGTHFTAEVFTPRTVRVNRYSFQRDFVERYCLDGAWRKLLGGYAVGRMPEPVTSQFRFIGRRSRPCRYEVRRARPIASGSFFEAERSVPFMPRPDFLTPRASFDAYRKEDLEDDIAERIVRFRTVKLDDIQTGWLTTGTFSLFDLGLNTTGFVRVQIEADEDTELYLCFDEILTDGDVDPLRLSCLNCIVLQVQVGSYAFESYEPYTMRYLKILCTGAGSVRINGVSLREVANPLCGDISLQTDDARLDKIFYAAVETFRFNAIDILMDCPSRERAGWLCDSYFAGAAEKIITGTNFVEHDFLENYCDGKDFGIAEKMIPMCYPAEHADGNFIPNWAMFFVIEANEYFQRGGKDELFERTYAIGLRIVDFLSAYENELGLLEDLPSWIFIEWSMANRFTRNVNFPSNMLYAKMLESLAKMGGGKHFGEKAVHLKKTICELAYDGNYFSDNAIREDGRLVVTKNRTEVCQYFAFFSGVADFRTHERLWKDLKKNFGMPTDDGYRVLHPANAFIGNYLRLLLLAEAGERDLCYRQILRYFSEMAEKTGTLWEMNSPTASLCHGFASYVIVVIVRCVLGIDVRGTTMRVDPIENIGIRTFSMPLNETEKLVVRNGKIVIVARS